MLIDEIYSAAIQGDYSLLNTLLSRRQANLNQMYDAGVSESVRTRFPLLFSVLNAMRRSRIDERTLALLVQYGADINGFVLMECAGAAAQIPFLAYAMLEWNSPEMTQCLLSIGADPCSARTVIYPDGRQSASPMLCLALSHPDAVFAELLLRAGADPNQHADVYVQRGGYTQQLPPLYYALIQQQSQQKCQLLCAYGASAHFPIVLSERAADSVPFKRYVQVVYPQLMPMLDAACDQQTRAAAPTQPAAPSGEHDSDDRYDAGDSAGEYEEYKDRRLDDEDSGDFFDEELPDEKTSGFSLSNLASSLKNRLPAKKDKPSKKKADQYPPVQYDPNRRCYGKFTAYLFGNFSLLTLAFMIIAPLCFMSTDKEMAQIFFFIGLPCFAICALLWLRVMKKAKRYGQSNVMVRFVLDSMLMFVRFMLTILVVTIPLVKAIGSDIKWEQRTTKTGRTVVAKKTGEDEYEDVSGKRYTTR